MDVSEERIVNYCRRVVVGHDFFIVIFFYVAAAAAASRGVLMIIALAHRHYCLLKENALSIAKM